MKWIRSNLLLTASFLVSAICGTAADWPQFRGPGGSGVSADTGLPATWSAAANIAWKSPLPGPGTSSPIVVGNRIFLTCYTGYPVDRNASDPGGIKNLKRRLACLTDPAASCSGRKKSPPSNPRQRTKRS